MWCHCSAMRIVIVLIPDLQGNDRTDGSVYAAMASKSSCPAGVLREACTHVRLVESQI